DRSGLGPLRLRQEAHLIADKPSNFLAARSLAKHVPFEPFFFFVHNSPNTFPGYIPGTDRWETGLLCLLRDDRQGGCVWPPCGSGGRKQSADTLAGVGVS